MNTTIQQTENSLFDQEITWAQNTFNLDRRLVKAILRMGFIYPTLIQSKSIPIALEGKDVLVQARTGSGKTIAYALPLLQKLLQLKENQKNNSSIKAIILAPTKELIKQTEKVIDDLTYYCKDSISFYAINDDKQEKINIHLAGTPDVIIATPAKLATQLTNKKVQLNSVAVVVVDEADMVFSYGYKDDVDQIFTTIPKMFQGFLLSATLPTQLKKFKEIFLHNPAILTLKEPKGKGHILQFFLESSEQDKFLILYVFLKLGLLQGKGLIFVNDVNKCYRLKLFLQQFYIPTAVLNAEIPLNSRNHILEEFNKGIFTYLIASDAVVDLGEDAEEDDDNDSEDDEEQDNEDGSDNQNEEDQEDEEIEENEDDENDSDAEDEDEEGENDDEEENNEDDEQNEGEEEEEVEQSEKKKKSKKDKSKPQGKFVEKDDYGVSRGIDFQGVNFVVNFDFPKTSAAYIHRIGRTARGIRSGTSLSFVTKYTEVRPEIFGENKIAVRDHNTLQEVRQRQPRLDVIDGDNVFAAMGALDNNTPIHREEYQMQPSPLLFNTQELEPFRYRVEDVLRNITTSAVRELRLAEIRREIMNSEKLKSYFNENPNDLKVLRHDKAILHPIKAKEHLKYIPDYLIPDSMKAVSNVQMTAKNHRKNKKRKYQNHESEDSRKKKSKLNDPLYTSNTISVKTKGGDGESQEFLKTTAASGRKEWKMKHRKGEFNPKQQDERSYQTKGTFQKGKKKLQRIARN